MYAIIKTGGKQYVVAPEQRIKVEKLEAAKGDTVSFPVLLYKSDTNNIEFDVSGMSVKAKVLDQIRGEKIKIIKAKRRKHHRKQMGHRQYYSLVEISSIGG